MLAGSESAHPSEGKPAIYWGPNPTSAMCLGELKLKCICWYVCRLPSQHLQGKEEKKITEQKPVQLFIKAEYAEWIFMLFHFCFIVSDVKKIQQWKVICLIWPYIRIRLGEKDHIRLWDLCHFEDIVSENSSEALEIASWISWGILLFWQMFEFCEKLIKLIKRFHPYFPICTCKTLPNLIFGSFL